MLSNVEEALQRHQLLLPFSPFFFLTRSLHIDQGSECKSETRLCSESPSLAGASRLRFFRGPK